MSGGQGAAKQSSLQFHIWKHNIDQRMQDEMLYTILFSGSVIILCFAISLILNEFMAMTKTEFMDYFIFQATLFLRATDDALERFCEPAIERII